MNNNSWKGDCFLDFFNNKSTTNFSNKTIYKSKFSSPYKLLKSTHDEDGRCILPLLHTAGGLVGGDYLAIEAHANKNTKVLLTTTSAQKVYGSVGRSKINPEGFFSSQVNNIKIKENSHLEYLPQETIIFANGLFSQTTKVNISKNSSFLFTDLIRLGRSSNNETIENGIFLSKLLVKRDANNFDDWEFVDQIELNKISFEAKTGMDKMPVFGSLVWIYEKDFSKIKINSLVYEIKKIFLISNNHLSLGILKNGLSIRFLGNSTQDARNCFFLIWKQIRHISGFCTPKYQGVWPLQDSINY